MTDNRRSGIEFERRVGRYLTSNGYQVIRAAGSRGPADLIALKVGQVLLVQCKTSGRLGPDDRRSLLQLAALTGGTPLLASRTGRVLQIRKLTHDGPVATSAIDYALD